MIMSSPVLDINKAPQKSQQCFHDADRVYGGNENGRIDTKDEADKAAEVCCREDHDLCLSARDHLKKNGFVLEIKEDPWQRRSVRIETAPDTLKLNLTKADRSDLSFFEEGDGKINSDREIYEAVDSCREDPDCDSEEMARYLVGSRRPVTERALVLSALFDIGFPTSSYFFTKPVGEDALDIPTHPEDVEYGRASGPIRLGDKLEDVAGTRYRYGFKADLWQYVFLKYMMGWKGMNVPSCVRRQYANHYDAYTATCFQLKRTHYFTMGFYPYISPASRREYLDVLPPDLELESVNPATTMKYAGLFVSAEAGLVAGEFTYDFGWHRWGHYEFPEEQQQSTNRLGLTAEIDCQMARLMGLEVGLATDVFPERYYSIMIKAGVSLGIILHRDVSR
jgi:hypothetical protein